MMRLAPARPSREVSLPSPRVRQIELRGDLVLSEADFKQSVRKRRRIRIGLAVFAVGLAGLGSISLRVAFILTALRTAASEPERVRRPGPGGPFHCRRGTWTEGRLPDRRRGRATEMGRGEPRSPGDRPLGFGPSNAGSLYRPPAEQLQAHMDKISDLRQLCRLMGASARLAEIKGDAARGHSETVST